MKDWEIIVQYFNLLCICIWQYTRMTHGRQGPHDVLTIKYPVVRMFIWKVYFHVWCFMMTWYAVNICTKTTLYRIVWKHLYFHGYFIKDLTTFEYIGISLKTVKHAPRKPWPYCLSKLSSIHWLINSIFRNMNRNLRVFQELCKTAIL